MWAGDPRRGRSVGRRLAAVKAGLARAVAAWQAGNAMSTSRAGRLCVGVDENGLGPRLGPLVVTAAMARISRGAEQELGRGEPGDDLATRLGDSKGLVAHGDVALGEAWARAVVERGAGRAVVAGGSADEVLGSLLLEPRSALRASCPAGLEGQCWGRDGDSALHGAGQPGRERVAAHLSRVRGDLDGLAARGIELVAVRSVVVCTRRLNDELRSGHSRLVVDLHSMERLLLAMRELAGADLTAVCGKVGGYRDYRPVLGPLGGRLHAVIEETRRRSAYRFPGLGEVAFVQDADASDLLVGLASLVGKWVRELLMHRIVHHYHRLVPGLPEASGYNDPVTAAFVARTAPLRREHHVPEECFERQPGERAKRAASRPLADGLPSRRRQPRR
jgi:ribonuclease HII